MNRYRQLSEEERNFSINFDQSRESAIIIRPPHVVINIPNAGAHDDDPDTTERNAMTLLHRYTRLYFFFAGQWFWPAENFIKRHNLPSKVCRIAYAIWQVIVVLIMWSYFLYSMGFFTLRTIFIRLRWISVNETIHEFSTARKFVRYRFELNIFAHVLHGYLEKKCFRAPETTDNERNPCTKQH